MTFKGLAITAFVVAITLLGTALAVVTFQAAAPAFMPEPRVIYVTRTVQAPPVVVTVTETAPEPAPVESSPGYTDYDVPDVDAPDVDVPSPHRLRDTFKPWRWN